MKDMPFEESLKKLEKIVEELEAGDLSLDTALKKYEEGVKLANVCRDKLDKAKKRIEVLIKKEKGFFETKPFEEEE